MRVSINSDDDDDGGDDDLVGLMSCRFCFFSLKANVCLTEIELYWQGWGRSVLVCVCERVKWKWNRVVVSDAAAAKLMYFDLLCKCCLANECRHTAAVLFGTVVIITRRTTTTTTTDAEEMCTMFVPNKKYMLSLLMMGCLLLNWWWCLMGEGNSSTVQTWAVLLSPKSQC